MRTKTILSIQPVAEQGGSDHCLLNLVGNLTLDGWSCHVVMPGLSPLREKYVAAGATLHQIPMMRITKSGSFGYWINYALRWPLTEIRLFLLSRRIGASVLHSNSLHSWYGWAVAKILRRPHLWHVREIVVQSSMALSVERWLCRHFATRVIAVSNSVADQFPGVETVVIYDSPDLEEFAPSKAGSFRAEIGIADDVRLIGAAGRIDTWKGFEVLLDAVVEIRANRPNVEVVIAGGAVVGKESYARELADKAAAIEGVHWLGHRSDMAELIADLDLFVLASTEPEPFGMVLVEALASGVPFVATNQGGPVEIATAIRPEASRLVTPKDATALAEAVSIMLPAGGSSAEQRRARTPITLASKTSFVEVADSVLKP